MLEKKNIIQLAVVISFVLFALSSGSSRQTTSSHGGGGSYYNDVMGAIRDFAFGYQISARTAALEKSSGRYIGNAESKSEAEQLTQSKGYNYYIWDIDTKRVYAFSSESEFRETYNSLL